MMYNEELKMGFINSVSDKESIRKQLTCIFKNIGNIEEKYDTDFCFMNDREEVMEVVGCVASNRSGSTNGKLRHLRRYIEYCARQYQNVSNLINDITYEDVNMEYMRLHIASDPTDMENYLNTVFKPIEDNSMDIVYRTSLWLCYAGIKENDICSVKSSNVSLELLGDEFIIDFNDKEYPVPEVALDTLTRCVNAKEFKFYNARYKDNYTVLPRVGGSTLLRGIKQEPDISTFISVISRKLKDLDAGSKRISYTGAMWSGFFHRIYKLESRGKIDFLKEAEEFIADKEYNFSKSRVTRKVKIGVVAKELQTDYELWKKVFGK